MKRGTLAFVFLLGAVAGALGARALGRFFRPRPPRPAVIAARLTRELKLDDVQQVQVRAVIDGAAVRLRAIHDKAREDFEAQMKLDHERIEAFLRPDQKEKFDALRAKWESRRRGDRERFGPPPGS